MINKLCVIGHPSRLGGADTELDHQIKCWHHMGIEVHICHTGELDNNCISMELKKRGCIYHKSIDWPSIEGLHCISFCNGEFLKHLPIIKKYARTTTFVNCMTWNFPAELEMQEKGMIDFHLYQTNHAFERVGKKLLQYQDYRPLMFVPYFCADDFTYYDIRPQERFKFGRISRADADKFNIRQLWIYETMTAPTLKEGIILGWNDKIQEKFGRRPDSYVKTYPECGITQDEFYRHSDVIIMATDTFENLPRVGMEAMASGSILIVDNKGGWRLLIEDGVTGWLCNDDREFVYKSCRAAFEIEEKARMRQAARDKLKREWGIEAAAKSWETVFKSWENLESPASGRIIAPTRKIIIP